jgi:hypothetical protein
MHQRYQAPPFLYINFLITRGPHLKLNSIPKFFRIVNWTIPRSTRCLRFHTFALLKYQESPFKAQFCPKVIRNIKLKITQKVPVASIHPPTPHPSKLHHQLWQFRKVLIEYLAKIPHKQHRSHKNIYASRLQIINEKENYKQFHFRENWNWQYFLAYFHTFNTLVVDVGLNIWRFKSSSWY